MHCFPLMRYAVLILLITGTMLASAVSAQALGVAYLDGKEVWVATADGSKKVRLSAGEGDWNSVAQADNGRVVGVRNEPGTISKFSTFTIWNADGTPFNSGPLNSENGWQLYAYPLSLDLTADAGLIVYGYSNSRFNGVFDFDFGFYAQPATTNSATPPYMVRDMEFPTVNGTRVIARPRAARTWAYVQRQAGSPVTTEFDPWIGFNPAAIPNTEVHRTDVAANGRVAAQEFVSSTDPRRVAVITVPGLGEPPSASDEQNSCSLPGPNATNVSLSQDASRIAYKDDEGVKLAGIPTFSGVDTCVLTQPAMTISPTGSSPSLGPIDVDALYAKLHPPTPGSAATPATTVPAAPGALALPTASVPAGAKARALIKGLTVIVKAPTAGKVTLTLSIGAAKLGLKGSKAVVVARGTATAARAGSVTVKLKATKIGRRKIRRLKGKTATLRITVGTRTATKKVKLR